MIIFSLRLFLLLSQNWFTMKTRRKTSFIYCINMFTTPIEPEFEHCSCAIFVECGSLYLCNALLLLLLLLYYCLWVFNVQFFKWERKYYCIALHYTAHSCKRVFFFFLILIERNMLLYLLFWILIVRKCW